jgi:hypothetical protein
MTAAGIFMKHRLVLAPILFAALVSAPLHAEPREDVQKAFGQILAAGGFRGHAEGNVFGPGTAAVSGEIDVVFPDSAHVRSDALEFIVTPGGAWISALGYWAPADRSLLPVSDFDPAAMRKAIASIKDVREEGRAKTAQCAARVYRFRASGQLPGAEADGDVRMWVCETNARPARIEATDKGGRRVVMDFDWSRRPEVRAPSD